MSKIGFLGAGNMAEAIIKGIISARLYEPSDIFISDICKDRVSGLEDEYKISSAASNTELVRAVNVLVFSVKPQNFSVVLAEVSPFISADTLLISIAAGITTSRITSVLPDAAVIRVMPNTPALISQGAAALYANAKAEDKLLIAERIFSAVGLAVTVRDETQLDAVTALSGSGPAYFFLLAEQMISAGVKLGLDRDVASQLVLQTAKGSGILAVESAQSGTGVDVLRRKVTSPGGTTAAALKVFDDADFSGMVFSALQAAADRSRDLSGS